MVSEVKKRRKGMDTARIEAVLAMLRHEALLEIGNAAAPKSKKPAGRPVTRSLQGQKFGKWQVGARADKRGRVYYWCICDCGEVAAVDASNLVRGQSRQCRVCANIGTR